MYELDCDAAVVELLARLAAPRTVDEVCSVHPVRLDRFGIVLRIHYGPGDDHEDIRLRLPGVANHPDELAVQLDALLVEACMYPGPVRDGDA